MAANPPALSRATGLTTREQLFQARRRGRRFIVPGCIVAFIGWCYHDVENWTVVVLLIGVGLVVAGFILRSDAGHCIHCRQRILGVIKNEEDFDFCPLCARSLDDPPEKVPPLPTRPPNS